MLGVVREYNDILNSMDDVEMKIFAEKVRAVDRKILNGVNKLAWIHKGQVESFCKEGGKLCKHPRVMLKIKIVETYAVAEKKKFVGTCMRFQEETSHSAGIP